MVDKSYYNMDVPVSEQTLDELRSLGMAESIKKAKSGLASPEFVEAVRRFYPAAVEGVDAVTGVNNPDPQQFNDQNQVMIPPEMNDQQTNAAGQVIIPPEATGMNSAGPSPDAINRAVGRTSPETDDMIRSSLQGVDPALGMGGGMGAGMGPAAARPESRAAHGDTLAAITGGGGEGGGGNILQKLISMILGGGGTPSGPPPQMPSNPDPAAVARRINPAGGGGGGGAF